MLLPKYTLITLLLSCILFDLIIVNADDGRPSLRFSRLLNEKSVDLLKFSSIGTTRTSKTGEDAITNPQQKLRNIFKTSNPSPSPVETQSSSSSFSISSFSHKILEDEQTDARIKSSRVGPTKSAAEQVDGILTNLNQKPILGRPTVTAQRSAGTNRVNINPVFPDSTNRRRGKAESSSKESIIATTTILPQIPSSSSTESDLASVEEEEAVELTTVQNFDIKKDASSETTTSEPPPVTTTLVPERVTVFDNRTAAASNTATTTSPLHLQHNVHDDDDLADHDQEERENYLISETYHRQGHFPDFEDIPTNLATAESNQPARVNVRPASSGKDYEYEYIYYYYDDDDDDNSNGTSSSPTTATAPKTEIIQGGKSSIEPEKGRNTLDAAKSLTSGSPVNAVADNSKPILIKQSNLPSNTATTQQQQSRYPQVPRSEFPKVPIAQQSTTRAPVVHFPQHPKADEFPRTQGDNEFSPPILKFEFIPASVAPTVVAPPSQEPPTARRTPPARRPENDIQNRRPEPKPQEIPTVEQQPRLRHPNFRRPTTFQQQQQQQAEQREVQQEAPVQSEDETVIAQEPELQKVSPEFSSSPFIPISHPQPIDQFAHLQPVVPPQPTHTVPAAKSSRFPSRGRQTTTTTTTTSAPAPRPTVLEPFNPPLIPSRTPSDPIAEIPSPQLGSNSLESQESKARDNYARQKSINDLYALTRLHQLAINTRIPNHRTPGAPPKVSGGFIASSEVTTQYPDDNKLLSEPSVSSFQAPTYISSGDVQRIPTVSTTVAPEEPSSTTEPAQGLGLRQRPNRFRGRGRTSSTTTTSTESAPRAYNNNRFAGRRRTSTTPQPDENPQASIENGNVSEQQQSSETPTAPVPTRGSPVRNRFAGRTRPTTTTTESANHREGGDGPSTESSQPLRRRPGHFQGRRRTSTTPAPENHYEQEQQQSTVAETVPTVGTAPERRNRNRVRPIGSRPLRARASTTTTEAPQSVPEQESSNNNQEQPEEQNPTVLPTAEEPQVSQKVSTSVSTSTSESIEEVSVPKRGSAAVLGRLRSRSKALQQQNQSVSGEGSSTGQEASASNNPTERKPSKLRGLLSRRKLAESESKNSEQQIKPTPETENKQPEIVQQQQINADPNIPIPTNLPKGVIVQVSSIVTESEETSEDPVAPVEPSTQGSILNRLKSQRKPGSLFNRKRTSES